MIKRFKHKGLRQLFESGILKSVNPSHVTRLRKILALLETAETPEDMDLPGLGLHRLKGKRKETWTVQITGNWRLTFRFQKGDAFDINYEDYH
jgi:proteic killer suppression protein